MGHVSGNHQVDSEASDSSKRQPPRQQETEEVKCPRCDSTNTKFCYYNNYNKSQPRHFCKSCKRHWTKGGTLRSVPLGGGQKNKRPRITNSAATNSVAVVPIMGPTFNTLNTNKNTNVSPTKDSHFTNQNTEFRIGDNKKDVASMIYEALIIGPSSSPPLLLHETLPVIGNDNGVINETGEFQFSSLGNSFDVSSLIPSSCGYDQFGGNFDLMEESTVTSVNVPGTSNGPWPGTDTGYWDWNEIDVLTSADHLNIVWDDDAEIKP